MQNIIIIQIVIQIAVAALLYMYCNKIYAIPQELKSMHNKERYISAGIYHKSLWNTTLKRVWHPESG